MQSNHRYFPQFMYYHLKELVYTVRVGTPDPRFGNMLLEQFGGANGELAAAMQYSVQGLNCDDPSHAGQQKLRRHTYIRFGRANTIRIWAEESKVERGSEEPNQ